MNFKDQVDQDITKVFHNALEFAEVVEFYINDTPKKALAVLDYGKYTDREKTKSDHAEGLFLCDLIMYVSLEDMGQMPRKGQVMEIRGEEYNIEKVVLEMGELTIYLERMME